MLSTTCILGSITSSVVPTFTKSSSADAHRTLASKYKISQSIVSFLYTCPSVQPLIGSFARSKDFILALASLYGPGLTSVAKSFGGSHALLAQSRSSDNPDDWPRTWIQTKVALIELFALLDLGVAHPTTPSTPFLDHPLIADYHHAYNLSDKLSTTLMPPNSAAERDPRLDRLETLFAIHPPFRLKSRSGKITVKSESILVPVASTSSNINTNTEKDESASLEPKTTQILAIHSPLARRQIRRKRRPYSRRDVGWLSGI